MLVLASLVQGFLEEEVGRAKEGSMGHKPLPEIEDVSHNLLWSQLGVVDRDKVS